MASRRLEDLSDRFRPLAEDLIAIATDNALDPVVIETRRTIEEQRRYFKKGVSWTMKSKHLTGDAIDICPRHLKVLPNWAPEDPDWERLGEIGESLGLRWGGRWKTKDNPHFEYVEA